MTGIKNGDCAPPIHPKSFRRNNNAMNKTPTTNKELDELLPKVRERILQSLIDGETESARRQLVILEKVVKISRLIGANHAPEDYQSRQKQRDDLMKELEERFERLSRNS